MVGRLSTHRQNQHGLPFPLWFAPTQQSFEEGKEEGEVPLVGSYCAHLSSAVRRDLSLALPLKSRCRTVWSCSDSQLLGCSAPSFVTLGASGPCVLPALMGSGSGPSGMSGTLFLYAVQIFLKFKCPLNSSRCYCLRGKLVTCQNLPSR